ncbi:MAG TPA: DUF4388 domain-containing protein, partial [Polyangiaceae bacterium]|nr:DUF4388 domain-containing protein [Polyangiaceae bacterium]
MTATDHSFAFTSALRMKASHTEEAPAHGELAALVSGSSIELKALLGRLQGNGVRILPLAEGQVPDSGVPTPGLVLCDLASAGALAAVSDHFARAGDGSVPHLVTLGTLRGSPSESDAILLGRARLRYRRPLDVQAIASELLALLREPRPSTRAPQSQREITLPPLKPRASQTPKLSVPPRIEALPATSSSIPSPPAPDEAGAAASRQLPGPGAEHSAVSPELETLLAEAERRVQAQISATGDALASTPPEATSAHLSDDVWDALAEPLEDDGESPAMDLSSEAVMPPSPLALDPVEPSAPPAAESTIPPGRWQDPVNDDTGSFAPLPESEADDSEATSGSINPETAAGRDVGPVTVAPGGRHESTENHLERSLESSSPPSTRPPSTASLQQRRSAAEERPVTSPPGAAGRPALTVSLRASPQLQRTPPASAREAVPQARPVPVTAPSLPPLPVLPAEPEASEDTHGSLAADAERAAPPARGQRAEPSSPGSAPRLELPSALVRGGVPLVIGRAVRQRFTGCLAFEVDQGLRRIVFKDGDVVIAASAVHGESLVAFLAQRGDLSAETAAQIEHRIPPFGRHAGAALIARVLLQQSELWPVLRAHSEWVLAQIALIERGTVQIEHPVPERLAAEPAVFGGATGAEVLVEVIERAIAPARALEHLGSDAGKFAAGP